MWRAAGVPETNAAVPHGSKVLADCGENVCRLVLRSGLLDGCRELDREEKSRSVLLDCCTSGLVGGKKANDEMDDCEIARTRAREGWWQLEA